MAWKSRRTAREKKGGKSRTRDVRILRRDGEELTDWVGVVPAEEAVRAEAVLLTRRHRDEVLAKEMQATVDDL